MSAKEQLGSQPVAQVTEERQKEETEAAVEQSLEQKLIDDFTRHKDEGASKFGKRVGTKGGHHLRKLLRVAEQRHIVGPDLDALKELSKFVEAQFALAAKASKLGVGKQKKLVEIWTELSTYASEKLVGLQELVQNLDKAKSAFDQPDHADAGDVRIESPVDAPPPEKRAKTRYPPAPLEQRAKTRPYRTHNLPPAKPLPVIREEDAKDAKDAPPPKPRSPTPEIRVASRIGSH